MGNDKHIDAILNFYYEDWYKFRNIYVICNIIQFGNDEHRWKILKMLKKNYYYSDVHKRILHTILKFGSEDQKEQAMKDLKAKYNKHWYLC